MFNFGAPEDSADLFRRKALKVRGPKLPDCHWEEMEEKDLRNAFTYLYMSVSDALREGASDDVIEILLKEYDEVFEALAQASERFRDAVKTNRHRPVLGATRESIDKYKKLAGLYGSES